MATRHVVRFTRKAPDSIARLVERFARVLEQAGMQYDEDYTTLYGTAWATKGIILLTPRAVEHARSLGYNVAEVDQDEPRSQYTIMNVLVVKRDATYISTQVQGSTPQAAYRAVCEWAASKLTGQFDHVVDSDPCFVSTAKPGATTAQAERMEYTVGELARELN